MPKPSANPDAPSAWLLSSRVREGPGSVERRAGAPVTLFR